jgi:DNA-binding PadR family transcriptional regulator
MVNISITLGDLDTIVKALDSADIYINDTEENMRKFYEDKDELRRRLERLLEKWEKVRKIDEKMKWNKQIVRLGRGFNTFDEYLETQKELKEERRKLIEEAMV